MRTTVVLLLMLSLVGPLAGQEPKRPSRVKQLAGKLLDSAATSAASMMADSILGSKGKSLEGLLGTGDLAGVTCPAGTAPTRVGTVPAGVGQQVLFSPTAGQTLVAAAKKKLAGKRIDSTATKANIAAQIVCVTPQEASNAVAQYDPRAQAQAAQAAQAQAAAGQAPGGQPDVTKMIMGATPAGAMIAGATAAAPLVGQGVKAVGGFLRGKGQTKVAMIKDLAHGRLVLKGVKFIAGSDALEEGFEDDIAALAEALQAIEGSYLLNIPAEADGKNPADTVIARRRIQKLWAHFLVAGIQEPRLRALGVYPPELDATKKPPKLGESKVEIIRLPADFKP